MAEQPKSRFGKGRVSRHLVQYTIAGVIVILFIVFVSKYGTDSTPVGVKERLAKEKKEQTEKINDAKTGAPDEIREMLKKRDEEARKKAAEKAAADGTAPPALPNVGLPAGQHKNPFADGLPPPKDPSLVTGFDQKMTIDQYEQKKTGGITPIRPHDYATGGQPNSQLAAYENYPTKNFVTDLPDRAMTDLRNGASLQGGQSALVNGQSRTPQQPTQQPVQPQPVQQPQVDPNAQKPQDGLAIAPAIKALRPVSSYVINEGTMIAGVMLTAINSQLPGKVTSQVTQDVYDSATESILMIPRGSRLVGEYNSEILDGQNRLFISYTRLIYPTGVSVPLGKMGASDAAGRTGMTGDLTTHFWEGLGSSLIIAMVAQATQPTQVVAGYGSVGGGTGSSGQILQDQAKKNLDRFTNMKSELDIKAGEKLSLLVQKDMELPPADTMKNY